MGKIKTAMEKALERVASLPETSPDEIARMENIPRGKSIGASFMNNNDFDLGKKLAEIPDETKQYVLEGIQEVLLMNITLPAGEHSGDLNQRAMEGIKAIKKDKTDVAAVLGELDHLLQYYFHAVDQTRERFKQEFEMRSQNARMQGVRETEQERMEFQEEWANVIRQLNQRFEMSLDELKDKIRQIN